MASTSSSDVDHSGSMGSRSDESIVIEPICQASRAIGIIDGVNISTVIWNKNQCKRILSRFSAMSDRFKSMGLSGDGDGGPIYDELLKLIEKGVALISSYTRGITGSVVSRTDNRDGFEELHEEINGVMAKLGFYDDELITPRLLEEDAEADKKDMLDTFQQKELTGNKQSKKLAKVGAEKTAAHVDFEKPAQDNAERRNRACSALPSYLTIDTKSEIEIDQDQRIRPYVPLSERDPAHQAGWASVKSGKWLGCDFAIKVFKCGSTEWNESQLLMEVGKLVELQHPHVVRLVGFGKDTSEECVFVMELMEGDLRQLINKRLENSEPDQRPDKRPGRRPFTENEELDIINQIAKGMYFMHAKGYTHGDLKCSNILVKKLGTYLEVKISDFRGSQSLDKDWDPVAFEYASLTRRPRWTAPEAIDYDGGKKPPKELLKKIDVYSFGMACFEIVTGKYPFDGKKAEDDENPLLELINDREGAVKHNPFPPKLDEDLKKLIRSCWNWVPEERPEFSEICRILNLLKSGRLDVKGKSCGGMVAAIFSQIKHIEPAVKQPTTQDFLRSDSLSLAPEYRYTSIPSNQLERMETIGQGSHGRVFKATWLGCTVAVKLLLSRGSNTQLLQQEVEFLIKVSRHPCIVQMVGLSKAPSGEHSIVMEYMDGDLQQLIVTRLKDENRKASARPFTFEEEALIITKIAWGMAYLHSRGLVHRDLNSVNVLAQDYSGTVDVKIVDFGRSFLNSRDGEYGTHAVSGTPGYFSGEGSSFYRAPEMFPIISSKEELPAELKELIDSKPDLNALKATDVYSFAVLCSEVLTGDPPCSDLKRTEYAKVLEGQRPKLPTNRHQELKVLITRCWCMDPKKRPTFSEICNELQGIYKNNFRVKALQCV